MATARQMQAACTCAPACAELCSALAPTTASGTFGKQEDAIGEASRAFFLHKHELTRRDAATHSQMLSKRAGCSSIFHAYFRCFHLHEYQSKTLLAKYGVNTQPFRVGASAEACLRGSEELLESCRKRQQGSRAKKPFEWVIKAQVLAGGRGKGSFVRSGYRGGVQLTTELEQVPKIASKMLGDRLVTHQTGPRGAQVSQVMIAESVEIEREAYFAIVMDRSTRGPLVVGSIMGGMDIEVVARDHPSQIFTEPVDIGQGLTEAQCSKVAEQLGFASTSQYPELQRTAATQIGRLYELFIRVDALQVEVNPFALISTGEVVAVDAKIQFDDNAAFRQAAIFDQRDNAESDAREVAASLHGLNYIGLQGNIGCLVNGAGLAMATMDLIENVGGRPANFLDVGGSATTAQVKEAFKILTSDSQVRVILVNIFGGIMKCDTIASGIVQAIRELGLQQSFPLVVRLSGTNVEAGKSILADSGLDILTANDMESAAQLAQRLATQARLSDSGSSDHICITDCAAR